MGLKITKPLQGILDNLQAFADEEMKDGIQPIVQVQLKDDQLVKLTEGYETTLSNGVTRGVTVEDYEAVGNFNRDLHDATKLLTGQVGSKFLKENEEEASFKMSVKLPDVAGNGQTITGAFYRPGEDEKDNSDNYTAVTTSWNQSADGKAIDEELAGLRKALRKTK